MLVRLEGANRLVVDGREGGGGGCRGSLNTGGATTKGASASCAPATCTASRVGKYQFQNETLSKAVAQVLCSFGTFVSAEGADRELVNFMAKSKHETKGPCPDMGIARELMETRLGLTWERVDGRHEEASKWAALRQEGGPYLLVVKVTLKDEEEPHHGDEVVNQKHVLVYHDRCLKSHLPRPKPFEKIRISDIANARRAGMVFDRFFESADWGSGNGLVYQQSRLLACWKIKQRQPRWLDAHFYKGPLSASEHQTDTTQDDHKFPNYHWESLPEAVTLIASGIDESSVEAASFCQGLAANTGAAADNDATGPGGLNMGTVKSFLINKGFSCVELSDCDIKRVLQRREGFFLFILSVLLKSKKGKQWYAQHAIGYHKQMLRDCMTKDKPFAVEPSAVLDSGKAEDVFDTYFKSALSKGRVTYKHCVLIGTWRIDKLQEEVLTQRWVPPPARKRKGGEVGRGRSDSLSPADDGSYRSESSSTMMMWRSNKKSRSRSPDDLVSRYARLPSESSSTTTSASVPGRLFTPITGECTSVPDALALLLKWSNMDGSDVPYDRLKHDHWLESVKRYIQQPVKRYLDSKGLKLQALPQGVLNDHLNVLKQTEGNHLLILSVHFDDDKHGRVPRITHGVVWLAGKRLLVDSRNSDKPVEVTEWDTRTGLAATRVFDSMLRPLAGGRAYKFCAVRSAYKLKRCFSTKPASHYGLGPKSDEWYPSYYY